MKYVSKAYREAMSQRNRNKSYMKVSIGMVNQNAQQNSKVEGDDFTYFSNLEKPLNNEEVSKIYATYEQNYFRTDGSMYFLPKTAAGTKYNAGIVTDTLCGTEQPVIEIMFNTAELNDIKGLAIDFGISFPTEFDVETNAGIVRFENAKQIFETETVFSNVRYMKFRAVSMSRGETRFRIQKLTFGMGIVLDDEKIIEATIKSSLSPIAASLPQIDFNVTIENLDKYYSVDNDDSAINFMETGQEIEVHCGYTLNDGTVEWFKEATLNMKSWSADDKKATFTAVDIFEYMQDEYKKGQYHPEGITLYALAESVFIDAGLTRDKYWIDPYLAEITVYNPLPTVTHKECLQLIANAGRSVLMQNENGVILIKSSFVPDVAVSCNNQADYSDITTVLTDAEKYEYASYEQRFFKTDGSQYFKPRGTNYLNAGYVSACISDENGYFTENPIITIDLESEYTFHNMTLMFGSVQPQAFTMRTYNNGTLSKTYFSKNIKERTVISIDFIDIDQIQIEFTRAMPYNRIYLHRILFGEATDYRVTYEDLLKSPVGEKLEKVKEMRILRTIYTRGTELKDLTQEEVAISTKNCEFEFEFNNPVHDLTVELKVNDETVDYGAVVESNASYWCKIVIQNPPVVATTVAMIIHGYEYGITIADKTQKLNNAGTIETWDNPLISSEKLAADLAEWVGEYYAGNIEYDLDFRGDPALDYNDLVYLESRYIDDLIIRLEEVKTKYNGSLSGSLVARRKL